MLELVLRLGLGLGFRFRLGLGLVVGFMLDLWLGFKLGLVSG